MAKKKQSKYVGSCGIYVVVVQSDGPMLLLVHRRSKSVSEKRMLATPGGIVERVRCGPSGEDFELGARATAVKELEEEAGLYLSDTTAAALIPLPVGKGAYWGAEWHRNYCAVLAEIPALTGPVKDSLHEVEWGGTESVGLAGGDGYHSWVDPEELLTREDLMEGCRVPLEHLLQEIPRERLADAAAAAAAAGALRQTQEGPAAKRARTGIFFPSSLSSPSSGWWGGASGSSAHASAWASPGWASNAWASPAWARPGQGAPCEPPDLQQWILPRVAIFDLDDTCWHGGLDRKPFKGSPFTRLPSGVLKDSSGNQVKFFPELRAVLLALHRAGVTLAVASQNSRADWCGEVMDKFILDEDEGLTWGSLVPDELRIINWENSYWPTKNAHFKDILEVFSVDPGGPCEYADMIFFDDGKKICQQAEALGAIAVRCPNGISIASLTEALERLTARRLQ